MSDKQPNNINPPANLESTEKTISELNQEVTQYFNQLIADINYAIAVEKAKNDEDPGIKLFYRPEYWESFEEYLEAGPFFPEDPRNRRDIDEP